MTTSEALRHLNLPTASISFDVVEQAYLGANKKLLSILQYTPPGTTKQKVMQGIVLLKEARDTLQQSSSGTNVSQPGKPKAKRRVPKNAARSTSINPSRQVSSIRPQANVSQPQSTGGAAPVKAWGVPRPKTPTEIFVQRIIAFFTSRYNRTAWKNLFQDIRTIISNGFTGFTRSLHAERADPNLFVARKFFRGSGHIFEFIVTTSWKLLDRMVASWIGAPILSMLIIAVATIVHLQVIRGESAYKVYAFPPCDVYIDGMLVGEAPSKKVHSISNGSHEIGFKSKNDNWVQEEFHFEKNAYYIFQVDFERDSIERIEHELHDLFSN
ncbi:hypothetical protein JYT90_00560 [bacterium AH-315-P07]|nr:hypothetical protein [bacterium AH-315-P07]